jgi:hypothetical protein
MYYYTEGREYNMIKPVKKHTVKKHTKGSRELASDDIIFDGDIELTLSDDENNVLEFYVGIWFNPDEVFGTNVNNSENGNWVNAYAFYDIENGRVNDDMHVIVNSEDNSDMLYYRLSCEEKKTMLTAMDAYCIEREGIPLQDLRHQ